MNAETWTDHPTKLNLGSGEDYREGWFNVDISPDVSPDMAFDLAREEWPLPSDHYDMVLCAHVLEHLDDPTAAMQECARVLAPGGTLEVRVPVGIDAQTDPTHKNTWTWETPRYFDRDGPYQWEAGQRLRLEDRSLEIWPMGPLRPLAPIYRRWADRYPHTAVSLPGMSGELRAMYAGVEA